MWVALSTIRDLIAATCFQVGAKPDCEGMLT